MRILGDPLFTKDATGRLKSRIGTLFLRTPALVTLPGVHATQRIAWIAELNKERAAAGRPPLDDLEINEEIANSVDLLMDETHVLIRPDPAAMHLAFDGDEKLQSIVSKRRIRYLNTHLEKVRDALRARGENWRMSRLPAAPEEMTHLIADSLTAIKEHPIYFYNHSTGTRFLTADHFAWIATLDDRLFRRQLHEIVRYSRCYNRFGNPEIDLFPQECAFKRARISTLEDAGLDDRELREAHQALLQEFRQAVPPSLRVEDADNMEWRNEMFSALTTQPNAVTTENLLNGMSPEFYRQIEWLPGCRIEQGEIIFDPILKELEDNPDDPELQALCDPRAKAIIFNYLREHGTIEYINIGRIGRSLSIRRQDAPHRAMVYVVHLKEVDKASTGLYVLRLQKWGVREHLDEGKELLRAAIEAMTYTDYVLDRRLACRQLGMSLPDRLTAGRFSEAYDGKTQRYRGARLWVGYFERDYVSGCATDKIQRHCYTNPDFNRSLAALLGAAAAINCIVGRANTEGGVLFDDGDEVVVFDDDGQPARLIVSDHTGAFANYTAPLHCDANAYASPVNSRAGVVTDIEEFATIYLEAFQRRFEQSQAEYRRNRKAFDMLFSHRPLDPAGSVSYRWQCALSRLDNTDAASLCAVVRKHIKTGQS